MANEHKVEVDYFRNTLTIDDDVYVSDKVIKNKIDGINHITKVIYRKATQKEIDDRINRVVQAIKSQVNIDEVLRELVKHEMSNVKIKQVVNQLDKGKPVKRHNACMGFKFGNKYVQLIS